MLFKVGDTVKIVRKVEPIIWNNVGLMDCTLGTIATIIHIYSLQSIRLSNSWNYNPACLSLNLKEKVKLPKQPKWKTAWKGAI